MKRSRIICSIITVIYSILLLFVTACLIKSRIEIETGISIYFKAIHVALFGACVLAYMIIKKKLNKKVKSAKLIYSYRYLYLAVLVFVSRLAIAYVLKNRIGLEDTVPSFSNGLGSYFVYGMAKLAGSTMYGIVITNTIITFVNVVAIKRLIYCITSSDMLSAAGSVLYILLPQSLYYSTTYIRYNFNLVFVLLGLLVLTKIIDEVKQYKWKSKTYLYRSCIVAILATLDMVFGGSCFMWVLVVLGILISAKSVDITHISLGEKIREKHNPRLNRFIHRIERINLSKLINVALIITFIPIIVAILSNLLNMNNFEMVNSFGMLVNKLVYTLRHARTYYILLIVCILLFEIIGVVLRRKDDLKMVMIKLALVAVTVLLPITKNGTYIACTFDALLIITFIINICNIYYNREEKIKLLQEKNKIRQENN